MTRNKLDTPKVSAGFDINAQAGFPLGWVHDVTWAPTEQAPALSVHAYSPPLTAMSYYEVTRHNTLRRVAPRWPTPPRVK